MSTVGSGWNPIAGFGAETGSITLIWPCTVVQVPFAANAGMEERRAAALAAATENRERRFMLQRVSNPGATLPIAPSPRNHSQPMQGRDAGAPAGTSCWGTFVPPGR